MRMRAMSGQAESKSRQRRYSPELKERAVRMVLALREETGEKHGSVKRVAEQLDIGVESLRSWVKQYEIDHGERPGVTSEEAARIKELEQENKELRRANAILKSASAFFAAELDRPSR
jgi:transposase